MKSVGGVAAQVLSAGRDSKRAECRRLPAFAIAVAAWRRFVPVLAAVVLFVAAPSSRAQDEDRLSQALRTARETSGVDPAKARAQLAGVRAAAIAGGRLDIRLGADEAECRLLSDVDTSQAPTVVEAGLAAARSAETAVSAAAEARLALLRLRACAADVQFDRGETAAANAELEAILAASAGEARFAAAYALALLERGLHRSRRGDLTGGQQDLLAACTSLEKLGDPSDTDLCLGHLANHYKRVGDTDEALKLMNRLVSDAERRKATFDLGVYAFSIAQVHQERGELTEAVRRYEQSLAISIALKDVSGTIYAEHGIGNCLLLQGMPGEALRHIDRAADRLRATPDDRIQAARTHVLRATALADLQRATEAAAELARYEAEVRGYGDELLLGEWLAAEAKAQAQLGHWHEAYTALSAWRSIDERMQAQRQSEQSARLRMQFNREKDAGEMRALELANAQGQRLRTVQALALVLFVALLLVALFYVAHKVKQSRRLHLLATTDELTGLPNRRAILAYLDDLLRLAGNQGPRPSVLMIDADHFKDINDSHGHHVGDEVLRQLASLLAANMRAHDRLGRFGGEEFLAVLSDAGGEHPFAIAERMRQGVAVSPCATAAGPITVTVSIGVATMVEGDTHSATLLARADRELYAAKTRGRNLVSG